MPFTAPFAAMGYVGFVQFEGGAFQSNGLIRAFSADVRLSQEITAPDVVDGSTDRTAYQLGPKIVGGGVEFPAVFDRSGAGSSTADVATLIYDACVNRTTGGQLESQFNISTRYTNQAASSFKYEDCIVNSFRFSVTQSDVIRIGIDVIGKSRIAAGPQTATNFDNTRIAVWADALFNILDTSQNNLDISGNHVRSLEVNINNNADRFYTLNGLLEPQDIAARKRDVEGSVTLMGRHPDLGNAAFSNEDRCYEETKLGFGYSVNNANCSGAFGSVLPNVILFIEELSLTNDLFETTVRFRSLPAASLLTLNDDPLRRANASVDLGVMFPGVTFP